MGKPVLLLDLGGVLTDLGDPVAAMGLDMSTDEFWRVWMDSPAVHLFETGGMPADEFLATISAELGCGDDASFPQRFRGWRPHPFPGIQQLVEAAARDYRVALLSNTNEIHWSQVSSATPVFSVFAELFLSYQTGLHKPAPAAFRRVIEHFGVAPVDIVFFDDSRPNVDAARELGIDAYHVSGPSDVMRHLDRE